MIRKAFVLGLLLFLLVVPAAWASGQDNVSRQNVSYAGTFLDNLASELGHKIIGTYDQHGRVINPGAITFFASGIDTMLSAQPASAISFAQYFVNRLHFPGAPEAAYAVTAPGGIGYTRLEPLLGFWLMMRNIAYWFFSIAFVIAGLMIMFRFKIDPKTAASVQSALPKIIFALLLVTFSYAIAGLLIDIMYVAIALILAQIKNLDPSNPAMGTFIDEFRNRIATRSIFFTGLQGYPAEGAALAVGQIVTEFLRAPLGEVGGSLAGIVTGGIAALIVAIAVLWVLFKTWLMLLNAYAMIILNILFAPVMLMLDAIPGQNQFSGWLRNMLAYLMSFPAVILLMFVGAMLSISPEKIEGTGFVPPLIGGNSQAAIQGIVGLAIFLTIPKTVEALQQILKTPKNEFGSAWSEALGASFAAVRAGATGAAGKAYEMTGIPQSRAAAQKLAAEERAKSPGLGGRLARAGVTNPAGAVNPTGSSTGGKTP